MRAIRFVASILAASNATNAVATEIARFAFGIKD
jgi:hypothetical protein